MLSENIKNYRKAKGLSQEELAERLNVVRQTVSKWERGLSVPDAEALIRLAEVLDTTVSELLDRTRETEEASELETLAARLEQVNSQLAAEREKRRKHRRIFFIALGVLALLGLLLQLASACYESWVVGQMTGAVGIIGGSDGPTQIYITGMPLEPFGGLGSVLLLIVAAVGIYRTKK